MTCITQEMTSLWSFFYFWSNIQDIPQHCSKQMSSYKVSVFLFGNVIHPSPGRDPVIIFPLMTYKTCNRHIMGTGGIDLLHLPAAFHIKRQPVFPLPWQQNTRNAQNDRQIFLQHSLNTPFPDVLEKSPSGTIRHASFPHERIKTDCHKYPGHSILRRKPLKLPAQLIKISPIGFFSFKCDMISHSIDLIWSFLLLHQIQQ